jgi:ketosteroid isomerase-like protein
MGTGISSVIESAYAAWNEQGLDAFLEYWAKDVRWRSIEGAPDDRGPMHRRDAFRAYLEDWIETFEGFRVEPLELTEVAEDQVVAMMRYGGRARQSGVHVPGSIYAAVFVVRDGLIVDGGEYETRAQAEQAAALWEQRP